MDLRSYPAKGTGFPHIIRDRASPDSVDRHFVPGGPLCIATLRGTWREWDETSQTAWKPLHMRSMGSHGPIFPTPKREGRWWHFPSWHPNSSDEVSTALRLAVPEAIID